MPSRRKYEVAVKRHAPKRPCLTCKQHLAATRFANAAALNCRTCRRVLKAEARAASARSRSIAWSPQEAARGVQAFIKDQTARAALEAAQRTGIDPATVGLTPARIRRLLRAPASVPLPPGVSARNRKMAAERAAAGLPPVETRLCLTCRHFKPLPAFRKALRICRRCERLDRSLPLPLPTP